MEWECESSSQKDTQKGDSGSEALAAKKEKRMEMDDASRLFTFWIKPFHGLCFLSNVTSVQKGDERVKRSKPKGGYEFIRSSLIQSYRFNWLPLFLTLFQFALCHVLHGFLGREREWESHSLQTLQHHTTSTFILTNSFRPQSESTRIVLLNHVRNHTAHHWPRETTSASARGGHTPHDIWSRLVYLQYNCQYPSAPRAAHVCAHDWRSYGRRTWGAVARWTQVQPSGTPSRDGTWAVQRQLVDWMDHYLRKSICYYLILLVVNEKMKSMNEHTPPPPSLHVIFFCLRYLYSWSGVHGRRKHGHNAFFHAFANATTKSMHLSILSLLLQSLQVVFSITGSSTMLIVKPLMKALGLTGSLGSGPWSFRIAYIVLTLPLYSLMLLFISSLVCRRPYFENLLIRMWGRFIPTRLLGRCSSNSSRPWNRALISPFTSFVFFLWVLYVSFLRW